MKNLFESREKRNEKVNYHPSEHSLIEVKRFKWNFWYAFSKKYQRFFNQKKTYLTHCTSPFNGIDEHQWNIKSGLFKFNGVKFSDKI